MAKKGKTFAEIYYEKTSDENRAKIDATGATFREGYEAEMRARGLEPVTNADGKTVWTDAAGKADIEREKADASPPDTFKAVETAMARARTQMMMQATNGRAGSVLGIGADNFTGGGRTIDPSKAVLKISPNASDLADRIRENRRNAAFGRVKGMMGKGPQSAFNLGLAGYKLS